MVSGRPSWLPNEVLVEKPPISLMRPISVQSLAKLDEITSLKQQQLVEKERCHLRKSLTLAQSSISHFSFYLLTLLNRPIGIDDRTWIRASNSASAIWTGAILNQIFRSEFFFCALKKSYEMFAYVNIDTRQEINLIMRVWIYIIHTFNLVFLHNILPVIERPGWCSLRIIGPNLIRK